MASYIPTSGSTFSPVIAASGGSGIAFPFAFTGGINTSSATYWSSATTAWDVPMSPVDKVKEKEDRDKLKRWLKLHRPK